MKRNIRAAWWIAKILDVLTAGLCPTAHFQSISSDRQATSYAGNKLMMFWACCCATKHFLYIFMTP